MCGTISDRYLIPAKYKGKKRIKKNKKKDKLKRTRSGLTRPGQARLGHHTGPDVSSFILFPLHLFFVFLCSSLPPFFFLSDRSNGVSLGRSVGRSASIDLRSFFWFLFFFFGGGGSERCWLPQRIEKKKKGERRKGKDRNGKERYFYNAIQNHRIRGRWEYHCRLYKNIERSDDVEASRKGEMVGPEWRGRFPPSEPREPRIFQRRQKPNSDSSSRRWTTENGWTPVPGTHFTFSNDPPVCTARKILTMWKKKGEEESRYSRSVRYHATVSRHDVSFIFFFLLSRPSLKTIHPSPLFPSGHFFIYFLLLPILASASGPAKRGEIMPATAPPEACPCF